MNKEASFIIRLLDKPYNVTVYYNSYEFSVHIENVGLVADGWFTYSSNPMNAVVFLPRPEVSLFEDTLKAKVVRLMKADKVAWNAMTKYQHEKAWNRK